MVSAVLRALQVAESQTGQVVGLNELNGRGTAVAWQLPSAKEFVVLYVKEGGRNWPTKHLSSSPSLINNKESPVRLPMRGCSTSTVCPKGLCHGVAVRPKGENSQWLQMG